MIILSELRRHFPVRRLEWICAGIITGIGLRLLDPADSFAQPAWRELAAWADEGTWGALMFWGGLLRMVILAYNGAWRPSPELRGICAIGGGLIFAALALGVEASGVASPGAVTYAFLALGEGSNIWIAATDARVPYGERLHGKPHR